MLLAKEKQDEHDHSLGEWFEDVGQGDFAKNLENTADTVNKVSSSSSRIASSIQSIFGGGGSDGGGSGSGSVPAIKISSQPAGQGGSNVLLYTGIGVGLLSLAGTVYYISQQNN
ncbi:hypothetical protein LX73_2326 [Fodinibius salinus]|uniref:Uncharacterized protein n=1 Tax=Fodinibius salinus TaxID=860790 RepID=A0A5D3YHS6_9BACT|nr:hypothetical protein [Fodinibius salinus]TYP92079.1 hypothetical protein LX73_2326 [Fodinibius salinus]